MTLVLSHVLRLAERVTAVHEEALYSLDEQDPAYDVLRAETARRVLHECDLREVVGEVDRDRGVIPVAPVARPCNHLLIRDGACVGCGEPAANVVVPLLRSVR